MRSDVASRVSKAYGIIMLRLYEKSNTASNSMPDVMHASGRRKKLFPSFARERAKSGSPPFFNSTRGKKGCCSTRLSDDRCSSIKCQNRRRRQLASKLRRLARAFCLSGCALSLLTCAKLLLLLLQMLLLTKLPLALAFCQTKRGKLFTPLSHCYTKGR